MSSTRTKLAEYEIKSTIVQGEQVGSGSYGTVHKVTITDGIMHLSMYYPTYPLRTYVGKRWGFAKKYG